MNDWFSDWFSIIQACAIWLGALNLLKISFTKISKQSKDWGYSVVIVLTFFLMVIIGFAGGEGFREPGTAFDWLYVYVYSPLSATMFAILAFFVASASYRAFRARNLEATLLLLAAFFVMLGRVPVGDTLTAWLPEGWRLSSIASWVMNFPNAAGQRAIMIGIALGIVSTSLRIILGIERSHLGGE
jgi:diacylglycerol kinase